MTSKCVEHKSFQFPKLRTAESLTSTQFGGPCALQLPRWLKLPQCESVVPFNLTPRPFLLPQRPSYLLSTAALFGRRQCSCTFNAGLTPSFPLRPSTQVVVPPGLAAAHHLHLHTESEREREKPREQRTSTAPLRSRPPEFSR